jgi:hypothetical protein
MHGWELTESDVIGFDDAKRPRHVATHRSCGSQVSVVRVVEQSPNLVGNCSHCRGLPWWSLERLRLAQDWHDRRARRHTERPYAETGWWSGVAPRKNLDVGRRGPRGPKTIDLTMP